MEALPESTRAATLQAEIRKYIDKGYRVQAQTSTTAQLVKPKKFHAILFIVLLILAVLPAIIYVALYVSQKGGTVYLEVDEFGQVRKS